MAKYNWHLSNLVAFLRLNLFVKIDLIKWLNNPFEDDVRKKVEKYKQGCSFLKISKKEPLSLINLLILYRF